MRGARLECSAFRSIAGDEQLHLGEAPDRVDRDLDALLGNERAEVDRRGPGRVEAERSPVIRCGAEVDRREALRRNRVRDDPDPLGPDAEVLAEGLGGTRPQGDHERGT